MNEDREFWIGITSTKRRDGEIGYRHKVGREFYCEGVEGRGKGDLQKLLVECGRAC